MKFEDKVIVALNVIAFAVIALAGIVNNDADHAISIILGALFLLVSFGLIAIIGDASENMHERKRKYLRNAIDRRAA